MKIIYLAIVLFMSSISAKSQIVEEYFGKSVAQIKNILSERENVMSIESANHDSKLNNVIIVEFAQIFDNNSKEIKVFLFKNQVCFEYFLQSNTKTEHRRRAYDLSTLAEQGSALNNNKGILTKAWSFDFNGKTILVTEAYYNTYLDNQPFYNLGYSFSLSD